MTVTIYTLALTNDKYYVGKSQCPKHRILQHFRREGSQWTRLYPPIRVIAQVLSQDPFDEEKHTLLAMHRYGIDNVRGGSYCNVHLSHHERAQAQKTLCSMLDLCYQCQQPGHFAKQCPTTYISLQEAFDRYQLTGYCFCSDKDHLSKRQRLFCDDCCLDHPRDLPHALHSAGFLHEAHPTHHLRRRDMERFLQFCQAHDLILVQHPFA